MRDAGTTQLPGPGPGPGRRLSSSAGLGWAVEVEKHRDPPQLGEFSSAASPDLLLVLVTAGRYRIQSRHGPTKRTADYSSGSVAVTAVPSAFGWSSSGQRTLESLHLRLPAARVHRTLDEFGVPHDDVVKLDVLSLGDAYTSASLAVLGDALDNRAPGVYADAVADSVLVHLVHRSLASHRQRARITRDPGSLSDRDLDRVVAYMHAQIGADVDLDRLAGLVNISKFHFLRMFTKATGVTPHRYLVELRLQHSARLLRTTDLSVQQVAMACGYQSPSRFTASFRRRYGVLPTRYRR